MLPDVLWRADLDSFERGRGVFVCGFLLTEFQFDTTSLLRLRVLDCYKVGVSSCI